MPRKFLRTMCNNSLARCAACLRVSAPAVHSTQPTVSPSSRHEYRNGTSLLIDENSHRVFLETDGRLATQEMACLYKNNNAHYRTNNSPSLEPILTR